MDERRTAFTIWRPHNRSFKFYESVIVFTKPIQDVFISAVWAGDIGVFVAPVLPRQGEVAA